MQLVRATLFLVCFALSTATTGVLVAQSPDRAHGDEAVRWVALLDKQSAGQWTAVADGGFGDAGEVAVDDGRIVLDQGDPATGIRWGGDFPKQDYELTVEARRTDGSDFFCGLTYPVGDSHQTLILGGWGGWVVGLSCIDDDYAIDNETCTSVPFESGRWYHIRLRVTNPKIEVWIDGEQKIAFDTAGHRLNASLEMRPCRPLGIATWNTAGEIRNIRYRELSQ